MMPLMSDPRPVVAPSIPSAFVVQCLPGVHEALARHHRSGTGLTALDVAMGHGRHTALLAQTGFTVFGVDRDPAAVQHAMTTLRRHGLSASLWVSDLEMSEWPQEFCCDLVLCTRFLRRSLWPVLRRAVAPGGFVIYETFMTGQRRLGWGPRSSAHLLESGELDRVFRDWDVWEYEERDTPESVAQLLARKPSHWPR